MKLVLLFLSMLINISCGNAFDPRVYNKSLSTSGSSGLDTSLGSTSFPDISIPDDPDNDPFLDPDNNDINKHFEGSKFDSWRINATFSGNNTPTYWYTLTGSQTHSMFEKMCETAAGLMCSNVWELTLKEKRVSKHNSSQ